MGLTESTMHLGLGSTAPRFELPDCVSGRLVSSESFAGCKALLVMFICNHCPYVKHVERELARLGTDYRDRPLGIVAISSNDIEMYPEDGSDVMKKTAERLGYTFPYCFDEAQEAAKAYHAACTPDFFLLDGDGKLVYRGQLDDSRPGNGKPLTGRDLRAAVDAVLADRPIDSDQKPSIGCNIKWKRGNAP